MASRDQATPTPWCRFEIVHLNDVFRPQLNITFEVNFVEAPLSSRWDTNNNGLLDIHVTDQEEGEEAEILGSIPPNPVPYNIRVFIAGNGAPLGAGMDSYGLADIPKATCWVHGSRFGKNRTKSFLLQTICHEIGHVLVGEGHPDNKEATGPAPLPETRHANRLMCRGPNSDGSSCLLVKQEWDEADDWLRRVIAGVTNE